ncbi:MAG: hypothetical protein GAK30_01557 [Paracidovorax wautersii]|uniref:Uncharacterized protein n=1 Tax=Paracidovorax wautersii TaxID=1177982 RepID=A0A7V8FPP4_9BURK|nr:MAG: hypothetical protein GAK30_01557 [Paracidovorax wautersii]
MQKTTSKTTPKRGRPRGTTVDHEGVIALRLPLAELERTRQHAAREMRSKAQFSRIVFLMGLAQYEANLAPKSRAS